MPSLIRVPFLDVGAGVHELGHGIAEALERVVRSGTYVGGSEVEAFEREFAEYVGAGSCVGVGNGLDALTIALTAVGCGPGTEVIVPSHTFVATWLAVCRTGAVPVPVEPDPATMNIDPEAIPRALTSRTRAIVPVHMGGRPADLPAVRDVAARHGLAVVEDAAQAHGASLQGRRIGASPGICAWSFYPSKCLGALGDAGAITVDDAGLAERMRAMRNYGSIAKHVHSVLGMNSRIDPLQAAVLRVKLQYLDEWNGRRAAVARAYLDRLQVAGATLPTEDPGCVSSWHLFVVRSPHRDSLRLHLDSRGVETGCHYPCPPHLQPALSSLGWKRGSLPIAEQIAAESLSLPIGPQLSGDQIDHVVEAANSWRAAANAVARTTP